MAEKESKFAWDAFISHASEDKAGFVRLLAQALASLGAKIWYDEFSLNLGDSLSQSIDRGLARSRFGIVVLSRAFMSKPWSQHELRGLVTREIEGKSRILPIWHGVGLAEVSDFSPSLADKLAVRTGDATAVDIALQILNVIRPDIYQQHPRAHLMKLANGEALSELQHELVTLRKQMSEFQCPFCQSQLTTSVDAPLDSEEKHWDVVRSFECGYTDFGGTTKRLCPHDPMFPSFEDYELIFTEQNSWRSTWICGALGKTESARKVPLLQTLGQTKEDAAKSMKAEYERIRPWLRPPCAGSDDA
jgi:TIR domain